MSDTMVTTPPEVVLMRASSTVFVKASSLVNLDLGAMAAAVAQVVGALGELGIECRALGWWVARRRIRERVPRADGEFEGSEGPSDEATKLNSK